jgi:predicted RecB family nuclease
MARAILLGGYAAKSCARATHNTYDETIPEPPYEVPVTTQALFDRGITHEAAVFARFVAEATDVIDLSDLDGDKSGHIAATVDAMTAGRQVILGGRLPDDLAGCRTGKPDVLLAASDGGYHPADVKGHMVLNRKWTDGLVAEIDQPHRNCAVTAEDLGLRWREDDLLQLAHYWRMLEACGHAAAEPWGAIVGTEGRLAWYDLATPAFETFSRSDGKRARSALERYDHEHDFRVEVAKVAQQITGAPGGPLPLVSPIGQAECEECRWAPVCVETLPDDDLSKQLGGVLSVREYLALRNRGVATVDAFAGLDVAELAASSYADETANQRQREVRLRKAKIHAELLLAGLVLRRRTDAVIDVPRADVEIDIDMECDRDGRVYLWGLLVSRGPDSEYVPFVDRDLSDPDAELRLARRCFDWIAAEHQDALVFHYTKIEVSKARGILGDEIGRYAGTSADVDGWVDLYEHVRPAFDSRGGLGLKVVATHGAGFSWRDEDPGGLQSQLWLDQARAGDDEALQRILDYNEDDVRATLAVRDWLKNL